MIQFFILNSINFGSFITFTLNFVEYTPQGVSYSLKNLKILICKFLVFPLEPESW